jgi:alkanesulfonate monooxygenase SsuD/methylene tetrahydromethanopterin reductase-like flavin-dependent oxidoreductase (luciferase family)
LDGKKNEAIAAIPDKFVDEIALVGSAARIKDRLQAWVAASKSHRVGTMILGSAQPEALRLIAETVL